MRKLTLATGIFLLSTTASFGQENLYPLIKELINVNRLMALRVRKLELKVNRLEKKVDALSNATPRKETVKPVRLVNDLKSSYGKGGIYELGAYGRLNPKIVQNVWRMIKQLESKGIPATVKMTRKYLLLLAYVTPDKVRTLKALYPDAFRLRKVENPSETWQRFPKFQSFEDYLGYLSSEASKLFRN